MTLKKPTPNALVLVADVEKPESVTRVLASGVGAIHSPHRKVSAGRLRQMFKAGL
jgi:hypothetical protein